MAVALFLLCAVAVESVPVLKLEDDEVISRYFYPGPMDFNCTLSPLNVSVYYSALPMI